MSAPKEVWVTDGDWEDEYEIAFRSEEEANESAVRYVLASDVDALVAAAERMLGDTWGSLEFELDAALAPFRKVKP